MSTHIAYGDEEQAIMAFFLEVEVVRQARLAGDAPVPGSASKAESIERIACGNFIKEAVRRRMARVVRKLGLWDSIQVTDEVLSEFGVVLMEVGLSRFDGRHEYGQYLTYLLLVAAGAVKVAARVHRPVITGLPESIEAVAQELLDDRPPHLHEPIQTVQQVKAALGELSERLKRTAQRVWFDGMPQTSVAAEERVSPQAIATRLHRVRRHLSERLTIPVRLQNRRTNLRQ